MRPFKDKMGRTWEVDVNIASIKRVRTLLKFDLLAHDFGAMLEKILGDPALLCDVLFCLVKPQADAAGVSDEDFGRALGGDALENGNEVLLAELADFTPNIRDRERVKKVLLTLRQMNEKARDAIEAQTDQAVEAALRTPSGQTSTSSPASQG